MNARKVLPYLLCLIGAGLVLFSLVSVGAATGSSLQQQARGLLASLGLLIGLAVLALGAFLLGMRHYLRRK